MFCNVICSHGMNMSNLCLFEHRSLFGAMVTLTDRLHICFMYETFSLHGIKPRLQNKKKKRKHLSSHCSASPATCEEFALSSWQRHKRFAIVNSICPEDRSLHCRQCPPWNHHQTSWDLVILVIRLVMLGCISPPRGT